MWRENALARKKFYDEYAKIPYSSRSYSHSNSVERFLSNRRRKSILKLMESSKITDSRFLEIGCADGFYVITAESMGAHMNIGVDIATQYLKRGKNAIELAKAKKSAFICADAENLPFRDKTFDLTLLTEVLEHCPHPYRVLQEFWRVSRNMCILSIPIGESFPWVKMIKGVGRFLHVKKEEHGHLHGMDFLHTINNVKKLGAEIIGIDGIGAFSWTLPIQPLGLVKRFSSVLERILLKLASLDMFICHRFPIFSSTIILWFRITRSSS